jgi:DNA-binding LacI/PurR family transcriptional regulator
MVKLVDVAERAGVSRGTASNVFTHPELVSEALKERVLAAAAELGYGGPSPSGRLLRLGKVDAIGITPPGSYGVSVAFSNSYLREFLTGVGEVCDERGASLTVISGVGPDKTRGIKNALVDGFILHQIEDASLIEARRRRLPFVVVDLDGDKETSSVRIDDRAGGRMAAAHLTALGHRHFAIFSVLRHGLAEGDPAASLEPVLHPPAKGRDRLPGGFAIDHDRLAGYAEALAEAGLSIDDMPVIECGADSVANASKGARLFFDSVQDATAVLAMTDVQAIAVIEEAQRRGIAVPGDLSVVGFDDIPEAQTVTPALTTIVHPIVEKGRTAARLLFEAKRPRHIRLPVSLVVRGSTKAPRGGTPAVRRSGDGAEGRPRPRR